MTMAKAVSFLVLACAAGAHAFAGGPRVGLGGSVLMRSSRLSSATTARRATMDGSESPAAEQSLPPLPPLPELNDVELAEQIRDLDALTDKWRGESDQEAFDNAQLLGFCEQAETINGRFAMFFFVTGLFTEVYTGQTVPEQVVTMLEVAGVLPPS